MPRGKKKDDKAKVDPPPPKNYNLRSTPDRNSEPKPDAVEIAQNEAQIAPKRRQKKKAPPKPYNDSTVKEILNVG